ncbi:hypothetical protein H0H92_008078 [Tricholoma furcatifolium]|nr:hypothetical protein H0H92_008078 [Tricholoma furcatifolium]
MQAQHYPSHTFHPQGIYHSPTASYFGQAADNFSPTGLDLSGFSRGSLSYPHQDYQHPDRGDPVGLAGPSSNLSNTGLCATGLGISGHSVSTNHCSSFHAEAIADFSLQQQQWQWTHVPEPLHGLSLAPVHRASQLAQHELSAIKSGQDDYSLHSPIVLSPAAQRPTPASMAILLNQASRSDNISSPQISFNLPSESAQSARNAPAQPTSLAAVPQAPIEADAPARHLEDGLTRERKHACTMCHKRFDRPSTLKKHFLVHTGEKAYVCDTCGRRFGVPSNLNRHVKRCVLKPVNAAAAGKAQQSPAAAGASPPSPSSSNTDSDKANSPSRTLLISSTTRQPRQGGAPKRRRRAPSPSRWVPPSLLSFNLTPPESKKCTPVPLPPVRRNLPKEERDSWDENVSETPYHPRGWKNVLPGPGLGLGFGGKDVRNLSFGGSGFMLGRVLVFDLGSNEER